MLYIFMEFNTEQTYRRLHIAQKHGMGDRYNRVC